MPRQQYFRPAVSVVDAARERMALLFDCYDTIHVSISGGKDSTVTAHIALKEAKRRNRKIGLFFLDEEVVYQSTVDQVEYLMSLYPENTNRLWLQIPFTLTNATSLTETHVDCWEPGKHEIWMRPKGKNNITAKPWAKSEEKLRPGYKRLDFYGAVENFERCYSNTVFIVGLRALESPNRWRAVVKNPVQIGDKAIYWATRKDPNVTAYPIYDWKDNDVWRYIHDNGLKYSRIYDMQFKKGFALHEMRLSSLTHERSFKSLCELPEFEPKTYERLCERIKGIAFAQETGKASKMFAVRKLPKNYASWRGYRDSLLADYPNRERLQVFQHRFARQLNNEYVARQQCRQLVLNDYENSLPIDNADDPRDQLIAYYREVL